MTFFYKPTIGARALRIIYNKVDGFIRNFDRTKCLVLFDSKEHDVVFNLIGLKSGVRFVFSIIIA